MMIVPSISPLLGNNPGFLVYGNKMRAVHFDLEGYIGSEKEGVLENEMFVPT